MTTDKAVAIVAGVVLAMWGVGAVFVIVGVLR